MVSKSGQISNCKQNKEIYNLQEKNQSSQNVIVGTFCSVYNSIKKLRKESTRKFTNLQYLTCRR